MVTYQVVEFKHFCPIFLATWMCLHIHKSCICKHLLYTPNDDATLQEEGNKGDAECQNTCDAWPACCSIFCAPQNHHQLCVENHTSTFQKTHPSLDSVPPLKLGTIDEETLVSFSKKTVPTVLFTFYNTFWGRPAMTFHRRSFLKVKLEIKSSVSQMRGNLLTPLKRPISPKRLSTSYA